MVSGSRKELKTLLHLRITLEQASWGLLRPGIRLLSPAKLFPDPSVGHARYPGDCFGPHEGMLTTRDDHGEIT